MNGLTVGQSYYVKIQATNSAGDGTDTKPDPQLATPQEQVPGKVFNMTAATGTSSGDVYVEWVRPVVPYHGFPCHGNYDYPYDCPTPDDGGTPITFYTVQYSTNSTFPYDITASQTVMGPTTTQVTLSSLNPGALYYVRINATNTKGSGPWCANTGKLCNENPVMAVAGA